MTSPSSDRPVSSLPLLKVATTMTVADPDVAAIWPMVIQAIQRGDISGDGVEPLLAAIRRREDHGVPGLRFRVEPAGGETILVAAGLDSGRCAAESLVAALEELRDGAAAVASSTTLDEVAADPDIPGAGADILGQLGKFFEQLPATLPTGDELRDRFATVRTAFGQIVSNAFAAAPEADKVAAEKTKVLESAIEQAGDDIARWTEARGEELNRALADVRDVAPARIAEGLRNVADWLEKRAADIRPAAGAPPAELGPGPRGDLDRFFSSLEKSFGALFKPDPDQDRPADGDDPKPGPKPGPTTGDDGN
jgi:hypothetical protein